MAKEKSTTELKDERKQLIKRGKEIIEAAKTEKRSMNEAETKEYNEISLDVRSIDLEISEKELENRAAFTQHQPKRGEKFSIRRAILAQMNGATQRDCEAKAIADAEKSHTGIASAQEGRGNLIIPMEVRAPYTAGNEATVGVIVDEDQMEMLLPLEANLVLTGAGVRMMTGLQCNIYWPKHSATQVQWEGENSTAKDGAGTTSKGTVFSPKRLAAIVEISQQLLVQENRSVEGLIRQLMAVAIAQKIEKTAFGNAAHVDTVPDGLFLPEVAINDAMNWANIVKMETNADLRNALFGNLAYVVHPQLVGLAKTKVKDASGAGGFIIGGDGVGMLNGYRTLRTNNVPSGIGAAKDAFGAVFGNWADYFLGQWGAIDMIVDKYTKAGDGMVRLVINSYWNMGKTREESFTTAALK
jgi:HK97 family phage major capsid protein